MPTIKPPRSATITTTRRKPSKNTRRRPMTRKKRRIRRRLLNNSRLVSSKKAREFKFSRLFFLHREMLLQCQKDVTLEAKFSKKNYGYAKRITRAFAGIARRQIGAYRFGNRSAAVSGR